MTTDTLYVIFVVAPAAGALLVVVVRAIWARRRQPRPADQEPAHRPVPAAATPGTVPVPLVPDARDDATQPTATGGPAPHAGATEDWSPLAEIGDAGVSSELISDIEIELAWAAAWHDVEQALRAEIERIFQPVLDALNAPRSFDELRDLLDLPAGELVPAC